MVKRDMQTFNVTCQWVNWRFVSESIVQFNNLGAISWLKLHFLIFFSYQSIVKVVHHVVFKIMLNNVKFFTDDARPTAICYTSDMNDLKNMFLIFGDFCQHSKLKLAFSICPMGSDFIIFRTGWVIMHLVFLNKKN